MKISVIIPTYKPQSYIWECLDSLVVQTFKDFEIIIVLNGCKEPYMSELLSYISLHKQINFNFMQVDQGGVSNARNKALDLAKGDYVAFVDDDDYVSPEYLEELYSKASVDTISLCYPYAFNDGKPEVQLKYRITNSYRKYSPRGKQSFLKSRKYFSGPCMKLIPRNLIGSRRFDVKFCNSEDSLFMFLISDSISYVNYTSRNAVYYRRIRKGSAVTSNRSLKEKVYNTLSITKEYIKIYINGDYSFLFLISRLLASFKNVIFYFKTAIVR